MRFTSELLLTQVLTRPRNLPLPLFKGGNKKPRLAGLC